MKWFSLLVLFVCLTLSVQGQNLDKIVDKANGYYDNMKYHKAIPYYQEAIALKKKNDLSLRTRLAYCHRMLNQMDEAMAIYTDIVTDSKTKPIVYYYFGESLMANGRYDEAKYWFLRYDEINPKDERARTMAAACEKAKHIKPVFPDITVRRMAFNSDGDEYAPMYYDGGLIFVSDQSTSRHSREYDWTGRAFSSIFYADADSAQEFTSEPLPFSKQVNKREKNTGPASLSGNGKYLYFSRNNDETNSNDNKYTIGIYVSERGISGWKKPELLPICNLDFNFMHPASSFTGDTIYFVSDKPNGLGETDIYMAYRKKIKKRDKKGDLEIIEKWMVPTNLGKMVNSPEREGFPYLTNDGMLYFASKGHTGFGGFDIFMSRPEGEGVYQYAVNLGSNINSPKDETSIILSEDKRTGYFSSNRLSGSDDDVFYFRKGQEQIFIQGEVMHAQLRTFIENAKVSINCYDAKLKVFTNEAFTNEEGAFSINIKPGRTYSLKVVMRGFVPFEYPIDATQIKDGEVLPFLIQLRQLEKIAYSEIDYEEPEADEMPNIEPYMPDEVVLNKHIDGYQYISPSIPARSLIAPNLEKIAKEKQTYYKKRTLLLLEQNSTTTTKPTESTPDDAVVVSFEPSKPERNMDGVYMDLEVIDQNNLTLDAVNISLYNDKGQLLEQYKTTLDGALDLPLEPNKTYKLQVEHKDFTSKIITICTDGKEMGDRITKKVMMDTNTKTNSLLSVRPIYFEKGSTALELRQQAELEKVVEAMQKNPNLTIKVAGYTDTLGDEDYNFKLSKDRAMSVAEYLITRGIKPSRIILKGRGGNELVNDCRTGIDCDESAHGENRRVEISAE